MNILLVEDEKGIADFIKKGLSEEYCTGPQTAMTV
jgi:DNA-binding response OmpR family regulator